jgi:hypothetical protein
VVYVDNDPMVRAYAGELLTGRLTTFVVGDLREPDAVLGDRVARVPRRYADQTAVGRRGRQI